MNVVVTQLEKKNFKVLEDGVEQTMTHFASEDVPISIGLVFDASASMGSKLLGEPFTTRSQEIQNRLRFTESKSRASQHVRLPAAERARRHRQYRNDAKFVFPGFDNHHLSLFRNFPVREGKALQFR